MSIINNYPELHKVLILRSKMVVIEEWFNITNQVLRRPSKFEINAKLDEKYDLENQLRRLNK